LIKQSWSNWKSGKGRWGKNWFYGHRFVFANAVSVFCSARLLGGDFGPDQFVGAVFLGAGEPEKRNGRTDYL